jgi:hypothetical protein
MDSTQHSCKPSDIADYADSLAKLGWTESRVHNALCEIADGNAERIEDFATFLDIREARENTP